MRHPERARFLEEDWFFEAITESYLPLLLMLSRLRSERLDFQIALTLTPSLCGMLRDPLLQKRFRRYLERTILLADDEFGRSRARGEVHRRWLSSAYRGHLQQLQNAYHNGWKGDLIGAFRDFQESGHLEIVASAATHGLLPLLLEPPAAARAQIEIGCRQYREDFGCRPRGFWLPECAYSPDLEPFLKAAGVDWFLVEAHGLFHADPAPVNSIYKPCRTPTGLAVFGRDPESSRRVWSADLGYPGAPEYREFYRDLGHELPLQNLREYLEGEELRRPTGLKFHRITGPAAHKELYDPGMAAGKAREHAAQFVSERANQLQFVAQGVEGQPVVVCAFDAELFGHWWFEGVDFLEHVIRIAAERRRIPGSHPEFRLTAPARYLAENPWLERVQPSPSTWGYNGYLESWLSEENTWIYPHVHHAGRTLSSLVHHALAGRPTPLQKRCLDQMARELLLAQSSDWAFLMKTGTAREYAIRRTRDHLHRFQQLSGQLIHSRIDESFLSGCESRDNLFPGLDYSVFAPWNEKSALENPVNPVKKNRH